MQRNGYFWCQYNINKILLTMKKTFTIFAAIAFVCIFEACSKKDNSVPSPVLTGFEGVWVGKYTSTSPDSLTFTLKAGNLVDGLDVTQNLKLTGSYTLNNTSFGMICSDKYTNYISYAANFKNDSLVGKWTTNPIGYNGSFYLVRKK